MGRYGRYIPWIILGCTILLFPLRTSNYYLQIACLAGIYVILIIGYDFILGWAGLLSLSHAAFYGIGAYTSALLSVNFSVPFWVTLPAAAVVSGLFGLLVGFPTLRLRGHYLALGTLAFGEIVVLVLMRWQAVTRGVDGVTGIAPASFGSLMFDNNRSYYYLLIIFILILAIFARRIHQSRFGRALIAIRTAEVSAEVSGIDTNKVKLLAFILSAVYAGIAGGLYAYLFRYISPETFGLHQSITILTMLLIGGAGSIGGSVLGAILLSFLPEWLRFLKDYYLLLYGVGIVLIMAFMPDGVIGLAKIIFSKIKFQLPLRRNV